MLYLVKGEYIDPGVLLPAEQLPGIVQNLVIPSMEAMAQLEKENKIRAGGIYAGARAGVCIIEAESNDEVSRLLQNLPFWGLLKWDVTPLQSFGDRAEQDRQRF